MTNQAVSDVFIRVVSRGVSLETEIQYLCHCPLAGGNFLFGGSVDLCSSQMPPET